MSDMEFQCLVQFLSKKKLPYGLLYNWRVLLSRQQLPNISIFLKISFVSFEQPRQDTVDKQTFRYLS